MFEKRKLMGNFLFLKTLKSQYSDFAFKVFTYIHSSTHQSIHPSIHYFFWCVPKWWLNIRAWQIWSSPQNLPYLYIDKDGEKTNISTATEAASPIFLIITDPSPPLLDSFTIMSASASRTCSIHPTKLPTTVETTVIESPWWTGRGRGEPGQATLPFVSLAPAPPLAPWYALSMNASHSFMNALGCSALFSQPRSISQPRSASFRELAFPSTDTGGEPRYEAGLCCGFVLRIFGLFSKFVSCSQDVDHRACDIAIRGSVYVRGVFDVLICFGLMNLWEKWCCVVEGIVCCSCVSCKVGRCDGIHCWREVLFEEVVRRMDFVMSLRY